MQWWWRTPRASDTIDQVFWIDDEGRLPASSRQTGVEHGGAISSWSPVRFRFPPSGGEPSRRSRLWASKQSRCSSTTTMPR